MKFNLLPAAIASVIFTTALLSGCGSDGSSPSAGELNDLDNMKKVLNTNADIAFATYSDSVTTAEELQTALATFASAPTVGNLTAAKTAWLVAREPYGQTEVYRFRDSPIDDADGPEGAINAWPLGEALIDYVDATGSDFANGQIETDHTVTGPTDPLDTAAALANEADNIIGDTSITIDNTLLEKSEAGDGADVIAGYHAIEFILWGQDLDLNGVVTVGSNRETAVKTRPNAVAGGERPLTDFAIDGTCTTGTTANRLSNITHSATSPCQRRHDFLAVTSAKLITDLVSVRDEWATDGAYRASFTTVASIDAAKTKFLEILTGMGTLSEGELAGERMQIAFAANQQEDEHSCFSDNTHRDIWLDAEGVSNSYTGTYNGYDNTLDKSGTAGTIVDGYGLDDYLADAGKTDLAAEVLAALNATEAQYKAIDTAARAGSPVDVQIMSVNATTDSPMAKTIVALNAQSTLFAKIATELELGDSSSIVDPDGSACDTTDPTAVCP